LPIKTEEGQEGEEEGGEETLFKVSRKVAHDHPKQAGLGETKANGDGE
jgi:hypothetical protein